MELRTSYRGMDWVIVVTDYDYDEPEPMTREYPGCSEDAYINDGYVQLNAKSTLASKINQQLLERGNGPLFDMLIELDQDDLTDQLLDILYDRAEAEDRDWEAEAEQAEWQKSEDFSTELNFAIEEYERFRIRHASCHKNKETF